MSLAERLTEQQADPPPRVDDLECGYCHERHRSRIRAALCCDVLSNDLDDAATAIRGYD